MHKLTCGVHLHGVGSAGVSVALPATATLTNASMRLLPIDSALVSVGAADPVPTPLRVPSLADGIHFALVGNLWNTNYPFWCARGGHTPTRARVLLALAHTTPQRVSPQFIPFCRQVPVC